MFRDFAFLWDPCRPLRAESELEVAFAAVSHQLSETPLLSFNTRVAARRLVYACISDRSLLEPLDGLLLPPPLRLEDLINWRPRRSEVEAAVESIPPELDPLIVLLPLSIAARSSIYDARLRAASRRLCWILSVPFAMVEAREGTLCPSQGDPNTHGKMDKNIQSKKRMTAGRVATIGAFAAVGGIALAVTGGLAAPLIAPAISAIAGAAAATAGAAGATAIGAAAATHSAALIALIAPVLSAAPLTAAFAAGGAGLAGYRAAQRTAAAEDFAIRSSSELDPLPPLGEQAFIVAPALTERQRRLWDDAGRFAFLEEAPRGGIVVPCHTSAVAQLHVAASEPLVQRFRSLVLSVSCELKSARLQLRGGKLITGAWSLVPPESVPAGNAAVIACSSRYAHPTGAGCALCYNIHRASGAAMLHLWILAEATLLGTINLAAGVTEAREMLPPKEALYALEDAAEVDMDQTFATHGVVIHCRRAPEVIVRVTQGDDNDNPHSRNLSDGTTRRKDDNNSIPISKAFSEKELTHRVTVAMRTVNARRRVGASIVNRSPHLLRLLLCHVLHGEPSAVVPTLAKSIGSHEASFAVFTNSGASLMGAEAFLILEVVNGDPSVPPRHRRHYIKLQFEVTTLNTVGVGALASNSLQGLEEQEITLCHNNGTSPIPVKMPGAFFAADMRIYVSTGVVELSISSALQRDGGSDSKRSRCCASLTLCVGGFVTVYDPRRPQQDQQLALWAPLFPTATLLRSSEGYVVHWADDYQTRLGRTIGASKSTAVAGAVGDRLMNAATSQATRQVTKGAIFAGFHAMNALKGAFSLPLYAVWATGAIDNAFAALKNRAYHAGRDVALALNGPLRSGRPVTLIGIGSGARVVVECLHSLYRSKAKSVVENVFLLGATVSAGNRRWREMREIVAGRLVNVYSRGDWLLALLYAANETAVRPMAGLNPVRVSGVENVDVTYLVGGHADYALRLGEILAAIPERPSRQMYERGTGSPGAVVNTSMRREVCRRMADAISSDRGMTIAVTNRIAAENGPSVELCCVASAMHSGFFDFEPPETILPSRCGICGVVGDNPNDSDALPFRDSDGIRWIEEEEEENDDDIGDSQDEYDNDKSDIKSKHAMNANNQRANRTNLHTSKEWKCDEQNFKSNSQIKHDSKTGHADLKEEKEEEEEKEDSCSDVRSSEVSESYVLNLCDDTCTSVAAAAAGAAGERKTAFSSSTLRQTEVNDSCGMIAYAASLNTTLDLLIVILFCCPVNSSPFAAVDARLVSRQVSEPDTQRRRRLGDAVRCALNDPTVLHKALIQRRNGPSKFQLITPNGDLVRMNYRMSATGANIDLTALLSTTATLSERRGFTAKVFDERYGGHVGRAAESVPLEGMRRAVESAGRAPSLELIVIANCGSSSLFLFGVGNEKAWVRPPPSEMPSQHCAVLVVRRKPLDGSAVLDTLTFDCDAGRCEVRLTSAKANDDEVIGVSAECIWEHGNATSTRVETSGVSFLLVSIAWDASGDANVADETDGWVFLEN